MGLPSNVHLVHNLDNDSTPFVRPHLRSQQPGVNVPGPVGHAHADQWVHDLPAGSEAQLLGASVEWGRISVVS